MAVDTFVITATGKAVIRKDPNATLDYTWDWTAYLADITDTIVGVNFLVSPNLTIESSSFTTTTVQAFISGGLLTTPITTETATCRITTNGGRIDDRTIYLKIVQK